MNTRTSFNRFHSIGLIILGTGLVRLPAAEAQVPTLLNYQGRLIVGGTNFHGTAPFKFALVDGAGATTYWSNNGSSVAGGEPSAAVPLEVSKGLYSVLLGDTTLPNMTALAPAIFGHNDVRLRVWIRDGGPAFIQLAPDQRVAAVGYALMAADVADGSITGSKLAAGAVDNTRLANSTLTVSPGAGLDGGGAVALGGTTTLGLADGGVTSAKLASEAVSLGRVSANALTVLQGTNVTAVGRLTALQFVGDGSGLSNVSVPATAVTGRLSLGQLPTNVLTNGSGATGELSAALNSQTTASAFGATAIGHQTEASGRASFAVGQSTKASQETAVAMGWATSASGLVSTALGSGSVASGELSTAMGSNTRASGFSSTALGSGSVASGETSTALGSGTQATNNVSTAMGLNTKAYGLFATAMGSGSMASGETSTALGQDTAAGGLYSTAMGHRAKALHDGSLVWADSQSADFSSTAANQFLIRAGGGVGINTTNPQTALHVAGTIKAARFEGDGSALSGLGATNVVGLDTYYRAHDGPGSEFDADLLDGFESSAFWKLGGNAGTTSPMILGTTNNRTLDLVANGQTGLRIQPGQPTPNLVGGYSDNTVASNVSGSTIAGGGQPNAMNRIDAGLSFIGGGEGNTIEADARHSSIGGGVWNSIKAGASTSTIGGGGGNQIMLNAPYSLIAGGADNVIYEAVTNSTISGGQGNRISTTANLSTISGGGYNFIADGAYRSFVGGGWRNACTLIARYAAIPGGAQNTITSNLFCSIAGGRENSIGVDSNCSTISGGYINVIENCTSDNTYHASAIGGGQANRIGADAAYAAVAGGFANLIVSNSWCGTIPGGSENEAGPWAFAAGYRAKARHRSSFVWADGTQADFVSTTNNQFNVRASGGVRIASNGDASSGVELAQGATSWRILSDKKLKHLVEPVDYRMLLQALERVPVTRWSLKSQDESIRHIGPMAQDFYAAFCVGEDDRHITASDADGVALAAIKGLYELVKEKDAEIRELRKSVAELKELAERRPEAVPRADRAPTTSASTLP